MKITPKDISEPEETQPEVNLTNIQGKMIRQLEKDKLLNKDESEYLVQKIVPSTVQKLKLLYRLSSKNGFMAKQFHKKCDGKERTIFICETHQGRKFGGINYLPWSSNDNLIETSENIIFSVDKRTVHRLKVNKAGDHAGTRKTVDAVSGDPSKGPMMGDGDLVISDLCHQEDNCTSELGEVYELGSGEEGDTYLAGQEEFGLKAFFIYTMN